MNEEIAKKIQAALADPSLQTEAMKPLFSKLSATQKAFAEIQKSMSQLQQQLVQLRSEGDKLIGAGEVLSGMIEEAMVGDAAK